MLLPLLIVLAGLAHFALLHRRTRLNVALIILLVCWFALPLYGDWMARGGPRVALGLSLWSNSLYNLFTIALALTYLLTVISDLLVVPVRVEMLKIRCVFASAACGVLTVILVLLASLIH